MTSHEILSALWNDVIQSLKSILKNSYAKTYMSNFAVSYVPADELAKL